MRKRGFTLIELLVVITVIALLVAILLPALSLAKNSALVAACKAQKHDIGIGTIGYETDFGDAWWVSNDYDCPWEDSWANDSGRGTPGAGNPPNSANVPGVGPFSYGNPAVALTSDFDPAAKKSWPGITSDGTWVMSNKQSYLSSAKYFFCPLFYVTYDKYYARYAQVMNTPTRSYYWGTDAGIYKAIQYSTGGRPLPQAANVIVADTFMYDWMGTATNSVFRQAKLHCNALMLDGSVTLFAGPSDMFRFMYGAPPVGSPPGTVRDPYGGLSNGTGLLPPAYR